MVKSEGWLPEWRHLLHVTFMEASGLVNNLSQTQAPLWSSLPLVPDTMMGRKPWESGQGYTREQGTRMILEAWLRLT